MGSKGGRATPRGSTGGTRCVLGALFHRTTLRRGPSLPIGLASSGESRAPRSPRRADRHVATVCHTHQLLERLIVHVALPVESRRQYLRTEARSKIHTQGMIREGGRGGEGGGEDRCRSIGGLDRCRSRTAAADTSRPTKVSDLEILMF